MKRRLLALALAAMLAAGCGAAEESSSSGAVQSGSQPLSQESSREEAPSGGESPGEAPVLPEEEPEPALPPDVPPVNGGEEEPLHPYLEGLVMEAAGELSAGGMGEYGLAKAAFDYMVENTWMAEPVGLELWRVHGGGEEPIPFLQQRALSPLRFGVGMCEDYAAALTLLLRGLGLEALYVPGLTYSVEGNLVDHAWTMVRIDGIWYHLDCQLEDNVSRRGTVRYRYFLKGDSAMSRSHVWGQRLIDAGLLSPEQEAEVAAHYLAPECPEDWPTPERSQFSDRAAPDRLALEAEARGEIAAWEAENGPLPAMELNTVPPVFGPEGFGPADEG